MELVLVNMEKAYAYIKNGNSKKAIERFGEFINDAEHRHDALGNRAWQYQCLGQYEQALDDYLILREEYPDVLDVYQQLASVQFQLGQIDDAIINALHVLNKDPLHAGALRILESCQYAKGVNQQGPSRERIPLSEMPSRPLNSVIQAIEDEPSSFPTSFYPGIGRFFYSFVRLMQPERMAETGTFAGYSSLCIAQAMEDNKKGHLDCFDLFAPCSPNYKSPLIDSPKTMLEVARGHLTQAGLAHRVTFHQGDSSANISQVFQQEGETLDMAFIDGDHTHLGAIKDWEAIDRCLKPNGYVLFHDTIPAGCAWVGPLEVLENLKKQSGDCYQVINLNTVDGTGVGVVQKTRSGVAMNWKPKLLDLLTEKFFLRKHWP